MSDVAENSVSTEVEPAIERKQFSFAVQCKMLDEGDGGFEGIASPFGKLDDTDDIVVAGTYRGTLVDFLRDGWIATDHMWGVKHDVGIYTAAKEIDTGLYVVGEFHGTPDAQAIRQKIKKRLDSGKSVKLSIGFVTLKSESMPGKEAAKYLLNPTPQELAYCESRAWVRVIFEVKLYEVSLVSVPAATQADVISVKSKAMHQDAKPIEGKAAEVEAKDGTVLGEWVEKDMTCRAIGAVIDALLWLIYDCIYPWPSDSAPPLAERVAILRQGWAEGLEYIAEVIAAILGDEAAETQDEAVETLASWGVESLAERKGGVIERKNIGMSPAGVPLQIHSERVLAAAVGLKDRLSSIRDLRAKAGRTFSQASCDRIEEHCKALDAVVVDLRGMLAGEPKAADVESDAGEAEKSAEVEIGVKAAAPGLQAFIRTKYNDFVEAANGQ